MGIEFTIVQELATISATLTELSSIARTINGQVRDGDFARRFQKMVEHIAMSYDVVNANLQPFCELDTEAAFTEHFDARHGAYADCYLKEISKPRTCADAAYEDFLVLQASKEMKTGFPLLKRTFERLDQFVDKWVTNDAWLAMSIDNVFKRLQGLLNEMATLKKKDPEDAFLIYHAAFGDFNTYLALITRQREMLGR